VVDEHGRHNDSLDGEDHCRAVERAGVVDQRVESIAAVKADPPQASIAPVEEISAQTDAPI
jgi:hypothetical protein